MLQVVLVSPFLRYWFTGQICGPLWAQDKDLVAIAALRRLCGWLNQPMDWVKEMKYSIFISHCWKTVWPIRPVGGI